MDTSAAVTALSALAQPTRLTAFRHLLGQYPIAIPAGAIARHCAVPHNTMSAHLSALRHAGLVTVARESRSMLYAADAAGFRALVAFLARDCCEGRPEICAPILADTCACEVEKMNA